MPRVHGRGGPLSRRRPAAGPPKTAVSTTRETATSAAGGTASSATRGTATTERRPLRRSPPSRRSVDPTTARTDDWNAFAFRDLPNADEPGLFVPPTLPTSVESDPVERVVLARDETANLAFGIERLVEGPVGDSLAREEFEPPSLRVDAVSPARDGDATTEFVDLANPGEDDLAVSGWEVRRVADGDEMTVFTVEDDVLPPAGRRSRRPHCRRRTRRMDQYREEQLPGNEQGLPCCPPAIRQARYGRRWNSRQSLVGARRLSVEL